MNICLVSANDVMWRFVMDHFAFPGNIDFAADDQGAFSRIIFERLCLCVYSSSVKQCLPSVNHEQFPMQLTHKHNKWLQILAKGRFSTETPLEQERRLQIQREQRGRRRQQETA